MSVKGKIARFYNDKPRAIHSLWIMAQVVSLLFVIAGLVALFLSPTGTAMGIVMKVYDVFVIALVTFLFFFRNANRNSFKTNELYVGYYIGLCMMTCMNLIVIAVLYGSQSNLIEIINGKAAVKTLYRLVASLAIFDIFFYVLYTYFSIRFHSDIMAANRSSMKRETETGTSAPPSSEMVLFKKPTSVSPSQPAPAQPIPPQSTPVESNTSLVLAKPQAITPAKPAGTMLAPPGMQ